MPIFKLTTIFTHLSAASTPNAPVHRTGSWTESWYRNANSAPDVISLAQNGLAGVLAFWPARAALLPVGSSISGYRIQQVSPTTTPTQSGALSYTGVVGVTADIPQMALLCKSPGVGVGNIRRFKLKAMPDAQVVEGEASLSGPFGAALTLFFLSLGSFSFRARDLSLAPNRIISITGPEPFIVQLEAPPTVLVNDFVRILRTLDVTKNARGGRFKVVTVGPGNTVAIMGWPYGACTLGSMRKDAVVYPVVDNLATSYSRVVVAKVGRPFFGYRGRRSKRR